MRKRPITRAWFHACEVLLEADPGRGRVCRSEVIATRLGQIVLDLVRLSASEDQVSELGRIAQRWALGRPTHLEWYRDYTWAAAQERQAAAVAVVPAA